MTKFFVFNTEEEAEVFCTTGCPIYGRDLEGNEVRDEGVTSRLADWVKHPTEEKWLVKYSEDLPKTDKVPEELDEKKLFPDTAIAQMLAVKK